mmetsp:Transcript_11532/g.42183  ORF Transcript_11532/g.42183 Transcript_11532/m.42183 type:complete len:366 (-) Transcript_11532:14-1111(-)
MNVVVGIEGSGTTKRRSKLNAATVLTLSCLFAFVFLLSIQTYYALAPKSNARVQRKTTGNEASVKDRYWHNLFLSSHGRVMRLNIDTSEWFVVHEGEGSYYGQFIDEDPEYLWVISRNPKPKERGHVPGRKDQLIKIHIETGDVVTRKPVESTFTHDAVRQGRNIYVADTAKGRVLHYSFPEVALLHDFSVFTRVEHVNTLAPSADGKSIWAVLHNSGARSCLAEIDLATGETQKYRPAYYNIGKMSHGLVHWRDRFIILNSGMGQLISVAKHVPGDTKVLWTEPKQIFMKGLTVVEDVAYFGICEFGTAWERSSPEKWAEVGAFDLNRGKLLWRKLVDTHGLLNIVATPQLAVNSTYAAVAAWN